MSDYLERLIGKARSRSFFDEEGEGPAWAPAAPTEQNSVRGDGFDRRAWTFLSDQLPALNDNVEALAGDFPTSPIAYEDLFRLLNKGDPRLQDGTVIEPLYRPQQAIIQGLSEADDLRHLRRHTRYDEYTTGVAMMTMRDRMRKAFEDLQDALDAIQQAEELLQQMLEAAQEALESGEGQDGAAAALQAAMDALAEAQGEGEEKGEGLAAAAVAGLSEARNEVEKQVNAASAYGLEDGDLKQMSFEERAALARQLDGDKMKRLADLVGQFRQHADAERRRSVTRAPAEVYDVELGNNLEKITASELTSMAVPELEDLFWVRYAKQEMLQWKVKGAEHAGRGPIIYICDESGSMGATLDEQGNSREAWSKAVGLALADQAKRGKRDFTYIGFSSAGQVWETGFEKGQVDLSGLAGFVQHFWGGGTSYERPLLRAMEICQEYADRGMTRPDIVFATDDQCSVDDEFVQKWKDDKAAIDIQCYGIRVGGTGDDGWRSSMASLCDHVLNVNRLTARPDDVKDLWRFI